MSLFRRLLGGSDPTSLGPSTPSPADALEAEQAYERELMRDEAERLSSDLLQRQLRYADRSWTPPAEGGKERATLGGSDTGPG